MTDWLRPFRALMGVLAVSCGFAAVVHAAESPWQPHNRIAISADGNPDADSDDVGATPMTLAILAKAGLQDKLVHYDFNNWLEYKPIEPDKNRLWHSAMGGQARWGFDEGVFFDAAYDPDGAIANLTEQINASTADDPLYLVAAGPVELVYRAIEAADPAAMEHVIYVSHHKYNNYHKSRLWHRNLDDILELYPDLTILQIKDQNGGLKTKSNEDWFWLRDHQDPNLQWVFDRIVASKKPDVSDAGMLTWLLGVSGDDEFTSVDELRDWLGAEPIPTNGGSPAAPPAPPAKTPEINLPATESIFQEVDGRIVIEAESVPLTGFWELHTEEDGYTGDGYLRYMSPYIHAIHVQARGVLIYKLRITEPGKYRMALKHSHRGAPERDKWNDCWTLMGVDIAPWGMVRKTYHAISKEAFENGQGFSYSTTFDNYGVMRNKEGHFSKPLYDLEAGDHYFFIAGRSGGYHLDKIHFFKEGVDGFQDDSIPPTPILPGE
ncbi:MAG: hypothetical protein AAGK09_02295 [Planctomycetota bacterium]